jgi:hypothetical protein
MDASLSPGHFASCACIQYHWKASDLPLFEETCTEDGRSLQCPSFVPSTYTHERAFETLAWESTKSSNYNQQKNKVKMKSGDKPYQPLRHWVVITASRPTNRSGVLLFPCNHDKYI